MELKIKAQQAEPAMAPQARKSAYKDIHDADILFSRFAPRGMRVQKVKGKDIVTLAGRLQVSVKRM